MTVRPLPSIAILTLVALLASGSSGYAQALASAKPAGEGPPAAQASPTTTQYPVDIERIQELVQRQPAVKLDDHQLRFYALVLAKEPNFVADFAKNYDFRNGPTKRGAAMTNSEFLAMSTPRAYTELIGSTSGSSFATFQGGITIVTAPDARVWQASRMTGAVSDPST